MADDQAAPIAAEPTANVPAELGPASDTHQGWIDQFIQALGAPDEYAGVAVGVLGTIFVAVTVAILRTLWGRLRPWLLTLLGRLAAFRGFRWLALPTYRRRVQERHGIVTNIYLDRREELDLNQVFVPLTLRSHGAGGSAQLVRRSSREILTDDGERRQVVLGDPGSGKTTLMKAIAAGVSLKQWQELEQLVPVFVTLRAYADKSATQPLFDYLAKEVLPDLGLPLAKPILETLLAKQRLLLILDGLDEVNEEHLDRVGKEATAFLNKYDPEQRCRVFVTCREQNYSQLPDQDLFRRLGFAEYRLGELSDNEVEQMVAKRTADFTARKKSPEAFVEAVRTQEQVRHLHRNPLLLTLSIALYLYRPREGVPQTLAAFYEEGIEHLLRRHDFPDRQDVEKRNRFRFQDKFELLRRFALRQMIEAAAEKRDFGDFRLELLIADAKTLAQESLAIQADEADDLVKEIHLNAGLIVAAGAGDTYAFAHRSFHEFCAAQQLSRMGEEGFHVVEQHVKEPAWRQATLFYASIDHPQAEKLVEHLLERSQSSPDFLSLTAQGAALLTTPLAALRQRVIEKLVQRIRVVEGDARRPLLVALISLGLDSPKDIQTRVNDELANLLALEQPAQLARELGRLEAKSAIALLGILAASDEPERRRAALVGLAQFDTLDKIDPLWRLLGRCEQTGDQERGTAARFQLFELLERGRPAVNRLNGQLRLLAERLTDEDAQSAYPFTPIGESPSNLAYLLALEAQAQSGGGVVPSIPGSSSGKQGWPKQPSQTWHRFLDVAVGSKTTAMLRSWCDLPKGMNRWTSAVPWQWLGRAWLLLGRC